MKNLIETKKGSITLHKIKGHAQELGNNLADKAAEEGHNSEHILSLNPWDILTVHNEVDEKPIEYNIRKQ